MSSIKTQMYTRKPFQVEAVRVTSENFEDVRAWCNGKTVFNKAKNQLFFKVPVKRPLNEKQTHAHYGDWVVWANNGFKVYCNKAFVETYQVVGGVSTVTRLVGKAESEDALPLTEDLVEFLDHEFNKNEVDYRGEANIKVDQASQPRRDEESAMFDLPFNVIDTNTPVKVVTPAGGRPKPRPGRPLTAVRTKLNTGHGN